MRHPLKEGTATLGKELCPQNCAPPSWRRRCGAARRSAASRRCNAGRDQPASYSAMRTLIPPWCSAGVQRETASRSRSCARGPEGLGLRKPSKGHRESVTPAGPARLRQEMRTTAISLHQPKRNQTFVTDFLTKINRLMGHLAASSDVVVPSPIQKAISCLALLLTNTSMVTAGSMD